MSLLHNTGTCRLSGLSGTWSCDPCSEVLWAAVAVRGPGVPLAVLARRCYYGPTAGLAAWGLGPGAANSLHVP